MIDELVRNELISDVEVTNIVGESVFLDNGHGRKDRYIVLTVLNEQTPVLVSLDDDQSSCLMQIDCFHSDPIIRNTLSRKINNAINKKALSGDELNVQFGLLQNAIPSYDTDTKLYKKSHTYLFFYNEV